MTDAATTDAPRAATEPPSSADTAKLTFAIEMLTKSIDRLDREIATLRSDARSDFRIVFGAIIASTVALAGLVAKTAHWF